MNCMSNNNSKMTNIGKNNCELWYNQSKIVKKIPQTPQILLMSNVIYESTKPGFQKDKYCYEQL